MSVAAGEITRLGQVFMLESPGSDLHHPHKKAGQSASPEILAQIIQRPWAFWAAHLSFLKNKLEND